MSSAKDSDLLDKAERDQGRHPMSACGLHTYANIHKLWYSLSLTHTYIHTGAQTKYGWVQNVLSVCSLIKCVCREVGETIVTISIKSGKSHVFREKKSLKKDFNLYVVTV